MGRRKSKTLTEPRIWGYRGVRPLHHFGTLGEQPDVKVAVAAMGSAVVLQPAVHCQALVDMLLDQPISASQC